MVKIYVAEPKIAATTGNPDRLALCYSVYEWVQGFPAVPHVPCSDAGQIEFDYGEGIVEIRQRVIDDLLVNFPDATSNDIIFLGGWN